jgi:hypothetical protein
MNKRGQFYLVAALAIIGIITGLATVYNTAKSSAEDVTVYDLSNEINFEAAQAIDSGIFQSKTLEERGDNLEYLTDFYAAQHPNSDLFILYGNESNITFVFYNFTQTGSVGVAIGGPPIEFPVSGPGKLKQNTHREGNTVNVVFDAETTYDFDLRPGQAFFVILRRERGGDRFVSLPEAIG